MADGEIRIEAVIDDSNVPQEVKKLNEKLKSQIINLNRQNAVLEKLRKSYNDFLQGIKKTPEEIGISKALKDVTSQIENMTGGLDKELFKKILSMPENAEMSKKFSQLTNKAKELTAELEKIKLNPENLASVQALSDKIKNGEQKASLLNQKIVETQNEISKLSGSKISKVFKNIGSNISGAFSNLRNSMSGANSAMAGFTRRMFNMAKTVLIFNLLRRGFTKLRDEMGGIISQDTVLLNSLETVRASLWTAFAPIWNACLPAIRELGNALAWISQMIASVVSKLFGKTVTQSQEMAKGLYAAGQSTKKLNKELKSTAKDAKKAVGELASFDKIEILNKKEDKIKLPKVPKAEDSGGGTKPLKFPVQMEFEVKNAETIDKITNVFEQLWRIVKPIIKGINDDITWLWNKLFGGGENGETWLDRLGSGLKWVADTLEAHPKLKDFLVSLAEGLIIAAGAMVIFNAVSGNWMFLAVAAAIGAVIFVMKNWREIVDFVKDHFEILINFILDRMGLVGGIIKSAIGIFKNWGEIFGFVKNVFRENINGMISIFEGFINFAIMGINLLINALNMIKLDIPDWIPGIGGRRFGVNIPNVPRVNIPRLAEGAVLKGGDPMLAYINDQPRGQTNIEAPLDTIVQGVKAAMQDFKGTQNQNVVIKSNGSLGELIRFLNFEISKEQNFQGSSFFVKGGGI
jgi:hypothetical protein